MTIETPYVWENGDRTPFDPDNITITLPNATSAETAVFEFAKTQSRVELEIFAVEELTIAAAQTLTMELFWDKERDGSFTDSRVINVLAPSVTAVGDSIGIITPETDVELFCKVKFTSTEDLSLKTVEVKLFQTA